MQSQIEVSRSQKAPDGEFRAARSLIGMMTGDATTDQRGRFLAYRFCGMAVQEAALAAKISIHTVRGWRNDEEFRQLEELINSPEARREMRKEVMAAMFTRNMVAYMQHDWGVLQRVLGFAKKPDGSMEVATDSDVKYLERARGFYSAQQMEVLEKMSAGAANNEPEDFSKLLLRVSKDAAGETVMELKHG